MNSSAEERNVRTPAASVNRIPAAYRYFDRVCGAIAMGVENGFQSLKCDWGIAITLALSIVDESRRERLYDLEIIHTRERRREIKAEKREWDALVAQGRVVSIQPKATNQWKAAEYLGIRPWALMKMRHEGRGPQYMKYDKWLSPRYRFERLDSWRDLEAWKSDARS